MEELKEGVRAQPLSCSGAKSSKKHIVKLVSNQDRGKMHETLSKKFDESSAWKKSPPEAQIAF